MTAESIGRSDEFSDEEIEKAFRFIDLDKNMHIGAAEIRHILVCMGELITDEEVDEMIRMCDRDGDGQVSYAEFYKLVTDPDPSRPDFNKPMEEAMAQLAVFPGGAPPPPGGPVPGFPGGAPPPPPPGAPPISEDRKKNMQERQVKKGALSKFATENEIRAEQVNRAMEKFHNMDKDHSGEITFQEFCSLMEVEPTGEYQKMFNLFDTDKSGNIDIKEFMLGLSNFTGASKEDRVEFVFNLFDADHNGFLTEEELIEILKSNHMTSAAAVKKKAQTIIKQVDKDGDARISLEEFKVVAKKFPNILFPAFQMADKMDLDPGQRGQ